MPQPTILVATWADGLFAITGERRTQELAKQSVRGLAPDGRGGALAIVDQHSLRRRPAGGEWTTVATSEFELSCCVAIEDTLYVGTEDARVLRLGAGGGLDPLDGLDRVEGRETWYAGSAVVDGRRLGPPLGIRSIAASSNGRILFANVHVGGIPRSLDGGKTWEPTIDVDSDVHEVCAHPSHPDIVVAASAMGLCISRDGGATWAIEDAGLHASYCSAVAFSGDDVLVSAATDHFAAQGRLYRRSIGADGDIVAVEGGLPEWLEGIADTGCIATNGSTIAVVDGGGTLYLSTESGRTWSWSRGSKLPTPSSVLIG